MSEESGTSGKRVLLIAPQPFYAERGTPMNVRLMATILGRAEYRVDLLTFPTGVDLEMENVRLIRLPNLLRVHGIRVGFSWPKLFYDLLLPFWGLYLCRRNRYQVIHGIEEGGVIAVMLARCFGATGSIYDMDSNISDQFSKGGGTQPSLLQGLVRRIEQWAIRNGSVVITVCGALTRDAGKAAPRGPIVQIEDIPLGFAFPPAPEDAKRVRAEVRKLMEKFDLVNRKIVLYTGNLQSYQGIDLLLESWGRYQNNGQRKSHRLVVVGGPGAMVKQYAGQLKEKNWRSTVVFTGPRPSAEMDGWMDSAASLVSPRSRGENTPLKIYSYMASGKPIIATRRSTHTQVLDDESAYLVSPDAESMAEGFARVLDDQEQAAVRGARARQVVRQEYSYKTFKTKLLSAYAQAGAEKQGAQAQGV